MSAKSNQLGAQAKEVTDDLREMGETVRDAAQDTLEQAVEKAAKCCEQGRETIHGVACACEQFIRERPLRSVLMAAAIGCLIGCIWKRR